MQKLIKSLLIFLSLSLVFILCFSAKCIPSEPIAIEFGDDAEWDGRFWYYTANDPEIYIIGTEPDVQKDTENIEKLYLPAEYKGKPITNYTLSFSNGWGSYLKNDFGINITSVKEIYYPYQMPSFPDFLGSRNYNKIFMSSTNFACKNYIETDAYISHTKEATLSVYIPQIVFNEIYNKQIAKSEKVNQSKLEYSKPGYGCFNVESINTFHFVVSYSFYTNLSFNNWGTTEIYKSFVYKANTAYMFNYEGAPNEGYFFINDFERGGLIENYVYEPTREGYTFNGWYKDSECTQKWDFEVDTLPAPTYDENGQLEFIETKLYAGWTKI